MMKYISVVVVTAAVFGGMAYYLTNRAAVADKETLNAKIADLESQVQSLKSQSTDSIFKFTELGIQLTIPESIKDLTYSTTSGTLKSGESYLSAYVSTSSITSLDKNCSSALGALARVNSQYPASPTPESSIGPLVKQFSDFYISYSGPQGLCSKDDHTNTKAGTSLTAFGNFISTITTIK